MKWGTWAVLGLSGCTSFGQEMEGGMEGGIVTHVDPLVVGESPLESPPLGESPLESPAVEVVPDTGAPCAVLQEQVQQVAVEVQEADKKLEKLLARVKEALPEEAEAVEKKKEAASVREPSEARSPAGTQ